MNNRNIDMQGLKNILNSRELVPTSMVGTDVKLRVQGNGNVIDVKNAAGEFVQAAGQPDGTVLQKKIINLKANSALAMQNARNRKLLNEAVAAEKAGEAEKASALYGEYLNAVQLSVGILLPNRIADMLGDGVQIRGSVARIDTENGSLLTLDPKTIGIVEALGLAKTNINIEDLLGVTADEDEDAPVEPTPIKAGEKKPQAIARIKADIARGAEPLVNPAFPELTSAAVAAMA